MSRASSEPRAARAPWLVSATVLLAAVAWSNAAAARTVAYAIAIGNNAPPTASLPVLRYADDDAVRYHELFSRFADDARLLAVLDEQTQRRYPGLGAVAEAPTLVNLARVVSDYAGKMAADVKRGDRPVLYIAFSGHGFADAAGAFLAMLDGQLTHERLASLSSKATHWRIGNWIRKNSSRLWAITSSCRLTR